MYMSHVTRLVITSPVSSSTSSSSHLSSHYRHVCQCQLPRMPGGSQGSLMSVSSRDVTSTFLYQANHWSQTNINLVKPFAKRQQHKQFCTSKTLFENVFSLTQFYTMFDQYYLNSLASYLLICFLFSVFIKMGGAWMSATSMNLVVWCRYQHVTSCLLGK